MELKIEKDIPLPIRQKNRKEFLDAASLMEKGDSILVPSHYFAQKLLYIIEYDFQGSAKTAKVEGGYRVWKV